MSQGTLSFNYKLQNSFEGSTQFAGLAPFIDLIFASDLHRSIQKHICARTDTQGYTDCQMLFSLLESTKFLAPGTINLKAILKPRSISMCC